MNRTLETIARTVLLASGMDNRWWYHAILYANTIHNVQYSRVTKSSPHLMMFNENPDVSGFQKFGGEAWLHRRVDQRSDSKFDSLGEPVIFVGYAPNQKGFLLWCPERGLSSVVDYNYVVFGPYALDPSVPLSNCWMNLCLRLSSRSYQLR